MASNVKAWSVSVEDFPLRFIVTIGTLDPYFSTTPSRFESRLQHQGCTKHVTKVQVRQPDFGTRRLPGLAPGAFETHTFPTPAPQNQQLAPRRTGSFVTRLDARAASGKVARSDVCSGPAEPYRGPIQAREVGNGGAGVHRGIYVPNVRLLAAPVFALVPGCLRSAPSSSARSAWLRHGSGMVGSLARRALAGHAGSHGTSALCG
jgi:hypothetical protein